MVGVERGQKWVGGGEVRHKQFSTAACERFLRRKQASRAESGQVAQADHLPLGKNVWLQSWSVWKGGKKNGWVAAR